MKPESQIFWYLIGLVAFCVGAIVAIVREAKLSIAVALIAIGLAAVTVVPFWTAIKAA